MPLVGKLAEAHPQEQQCYLKHIVIVENSLVVLFFFFNLKKEICVLFRNLATFVSTQNCFKSPVS